MNVKSLVAIILRLTALNLFVRVLVEISTAVLVAAGIYQRSVDEAPAVIGWVLVGALLASAILLWVLALPVARLFARGVPREISLGELNLADCYSLMFLGVGLFYTLSRLPAVWNWSYFLVKWTFHHAYYVWSPRGHGHEMANAFLPFMAGVILILRRRKWSQAMAGTGTHTARVSLNEPLGGPKPKAREPITISIDPRPR